MLSAIARFLTVPFRRGSLTTEASETRKILFGFFVGIAYSRFVLSGDEPLSEVLLLMAIFSVGWWLTTCFMLSVFHRGVSGQ